MASLKPRVERLEARAPHLEHEQITEVHHHIINPDRGVAGGAISWAWPRATVRAFSSMMIPDALLPI